MGSALMGVWEGRSGRWGFKGENKKRRGEGEESKEGLPSESTFQPLVRIAFFGSRHTNMSQHHPHTCLKILTGVINCHTTPLFSGKGIFDSRGEHANIGVQPMRGGFLITPTRS